MSSTASTTQVEDNINGFIDGKRRSRRVRDLKTTQIKILQVDDPPVVKKKRKLRKHTSNFKIPFDDLCGGIIQVIYSMLNDPRDLYRISQCSKRLRSLVAYEHVVRAAVFGNKMSSFTMSTMAHLTQHQVIFVPSVQRLLRLVNGTCCERGKFDTISL